MIRIHTDDISRSLARARDRLAMRIELRFPGRRAWSPIERPVERVYSAPVRPYVPSTDAERAARADAINAEQDARNARPGAWW